MTQSSNIQPGTGWCRNVCVMILTSALVACGGGGTASDTQSPALPNQTPGGGGSLPPPQLANQTPLAVDDEVFAGGAGDVIVAVLDNDSDPDGDALTLVAVGVPTIGSARIDDNGTPLDASDDRLSISVPANASGAIMVTYTTRDARGAQAHGVVTVQVSNSSGGATASNIAPVALDDTARTTPSQPVIVDVLANDEDPDASGFALLSFSSAASGVVTRDDRNTPLDARDDRVIYTPAPGANGVDRFTYTVSDGFARATASVAVTVRPVSVQPPQQLCGRVLIGPVSGATVSLYEIDAGGQPAGAAVATAVTDDNGQWCVGLPTVRPDYLVRSEGGRYFDPADSGSATSGLRQIDLVDGMLEGLLPADATTAIVSVVTSAMLIKMRDESFGQDFAAVSALVRTTSSDAFGFDPFTTPAANPLDPDSSALAARQYAMTLGGAAGALNRLAIALRLNAPNAVTLDALVQDLSDCGLDGSRAGVPISVQVNGQSTVLPSSLSLNLEILRFRNNQFDAYAQTDLVAVDRAVCATSAVQPDVQGPQFTSLPDDIVLADPLDEGVPADDGRLQPFREAAVAIDNRPGAVTIDWRGGGGTPLPARFGRGSTSVEFVATDAAGNVSVSPTRQVIVSTSVPPQAVADTATTNEDASIDVDVLANDTSAPLAIDPASLRIDSVTGPISASVTVGNQIAVAPTLDAFGEAVVTYSVANVDGLRSGTTTLTVTIVALNDDAPIARNDSATVAENQTVDVQVLANDSDADEGGLLDVAIEIVAPPTNGTATVNVATGRIGYVPNPNYDGVDTLSYRLRDASGLISNTALVSVNIVGVNQPPTTTNLTVTTSEDTVVTVALGVSDAEGSVDASSFELLTAPALGAAALLNGLQLQFTPTANAFGSDSLSYRIADNLGAFSAAQTVVIDITSVNDLPVSANESFTTPERVSLTMDVLANDTDADDGLDVTSVEVVSGPAQGTANVEADGRITYTSLAQFFGSDSFSYRVADTQGDFGAPATVTVDVTFVDDPPVAVADTFLLLAGTAQRFDPLANDTDPENALDATSVVILDAPIGSATVDPATGEIDYSIPATFAGTDTLTYTVNDVAGQTSAVTTMSIDVWPEDDPDFDGVANRIELEVGSDPDVADDVVVFVDASADPLLSDGTTWGTAYVSLAAARDGGALTGNVGAMTFVLLAGNASALDLATNWTLNLTANCDDLVVVGSVDYLQSEPARNVDGVWPTSLVGATGVRPMTLSGCDNVHLYSVRLTGGQGVASGGGALIEATRATLNDLEVVDNVATDEGGGVAVTQGGGAPATVLTINGGLFDGNEVSAPDGVDGRGGALALGAQTSTTLDDVTVSYNQITQASVAGATGGGGGIFVDGGTLVSTDLVLAGNGSETVGGGLAVHGATSSVTLRHSTISANEAAASGGGIYVSGTNANVSFTNTILAANYAQAGGGAYADNALDTAFANTSAVYNLASDGGAMWVNGTSPRIDDNVVLGNQGTSSADSIGGSVATLFNLNANNNVVDTSTATFVGTNNITADADFTVGYFVDHTAGSVSPAVDHSQTFQSADVQVALSDRFTDADGGAPDGGALDAGYHYVAATNVTANDITAGAVNIDPAGEFHLLSFTPTRDGVPIGAGRRVFVSGVTDNAQPRLYRYTTGFSDPVGTGRSTLSRDMGDGSYHVYTSGPFDTDFFLDLWIDTLAGPALVRYSVRINST